MLKWGCSSINFELTTTTELKKMAHSYNYGCTQKYSGLFRHAIMSSIHTPAVAPKPKNAANIEPIAQTCTHNLNSLLILDLKISNSLHMLTLSCECHSMYCTVRHIRTSSCSEPVCLSENWASLWQPTKMRRCRTIVLCKWQLRNKI